MNLFPHGLTLCLLLTWPALAGEEDDHADGALDDATRERLGIETGSLEAMELAPETAGYATVLDPAPLVTMIRQADLTARSLEFSRKSLERAEGLFRNGELVPEKTVEAARAQVLADEAAHQSAVDALRGGYGPGIAEIKDPDPLIDRQTLLVRITAPAGRPAQEDPLAITIGVEPPATCEAIRRAPSADPVFQAPAWLALVKSRSLLPGMSVRASLVFAGKPLKGRKVPAAAVVFHMGKAWLFHEEEEEGEFKRIEVPVVHPVPGGWFVEEGVLPETKIVTTGAQMLLSKETSHPEE